MDIKTAFLYEKIKKKVYIKLSLGIFNLKSLIIMLNKTLYSLK